MGRNPGAACASDLPKITWLSARRNSGFIPPLGPVSPRLCCQRCRNICTSHGLPRVGVCAITAAALPLWEPVRLLMLPVMSPVLPRHPGQQASTVWMALFFQGCRMCPVEQSSSSPRAQLSLGAGWELPSLSPWIGRQRAPGLLCGGFIHSPGREAGADPSFPHPGLLPPLSPPQLCRQGLEEQGCCSRGECHHTSHTSMPLTQVFGLTDEFISVS